MSVFIGISVGTDSCSVSRCTGDKREIAANADGDRITPTSLAFSSGEVVFGSGAKGSKIRQPTSTVCNLMPLLSIDLVSEGVLHTKCDVEVIEDETYLPTVDSDGILANSKKTEFGEFSHTASNLFGAFLAYVRGDTIDGASGGRTIKCAVLAVPRYMSSSFDNVLKCLGEANIAEEVRVIYDDVAALSAYGLIAPGTQQIRDVLVIDWGANSFSASVLRVKGGAASLLGWKHEFGVGGQKLDSHLAAALCATFEKKTKMDASSNGRAMRKLNAAMDDVRKTLTVSQACPVDIEAFCEGMDLKDNLSRAKLEGTMRESGWLRTPARILEALVAELPAGVNITDTIFVGGVCRMPVIKTTLRAAIDSLACVSKNLTVHDSILNDEVCALGASNEAFVSTLPLDGLRTLQSNLKTSAEHIPIHSRILNTTELVSKDTLSNDIGLVICAKSALKAAPEAAHFLCPATSFVTVFGTGSFVPMESPTFPVLVDTAIVIAAKVATEDDSVKVAILSAKPIRVTAAGTAKLVMEAINNGASLQITVYWQESAQPVWTPLGSIEV